MQHQLRKLGFSLCLLAAGASAVSAHNQYEEADNHWWIGLGGGIHFSNLHFSDISKTYFPENKSNFSGVFSIYGEFDFGKENMFAIRPQISLLSRGGRLSNIGKGYLESYLPVLDDEGIELDPESRLTDLSYRLKAQCFDIRVPLMYQIGKKSWTIRPYVYIAPILSIVNNGYVAATEEYAKGAFAGQRYDLNDATMSSAIFSGAVGIGAKWQFDINGNPFFLGVDFSYEQGFTNTYGKKEKSGSLTEVTPLLPSNITPNSKVEGRRTTNGFELQASIGIPLSIFSKKKVKVAEPEPVYVEPVVEVQEEVTVVEPDCYSLDEIIELMNNGKSVAGKRICAIDDINFAFAKSDINPSSYAYLDKLAETLKRTNANICVNGHTDNIGSAASNMELSRQRALSVVKYLKKKGVDSKKLSYKYFGLTKPITTNETEEGRRINRRVEFEILGK